MYEHALMRLGLAKRAGRLEVGEEPAGSVCRAGKARLLLIAKDAGDATFRRARSFCRTGKPPYVCAPITKDELGTALGTGACALCAITDPAFAKACLEDLNEPEKYKDILETLERQCQRVEKRRQEEKAHRKNVKYGKK